MCPVRLVVFLDAGSVKLFRWGFCGIWKFWRLLGNCMWHGFDFFMLLEIELGRR